jgi:hypothetical protein
MVVSRLRKKSIFDVQPLKGHLILQHFTASLKRCPDTKREFFRKLLEHDPE